MPDAPLSAQSSVDHCAGCGYDLRKLSTYYVRSGLRWCGACYRAPDQKQAESED